jgi:hypothetical protein
VGDSFELIGLALFRFGDGAFKLVHRGACCQHSPVPLQVERLLDDAMNNLPSDLACDGTPEPGSKVELIATQSGVEVAQRRFYSRRKPGDPPVEIP